MKKMFLTAAVVMLSMTAAFAEGENVDMTTNTNAYVLKINNYRLGEYLALNSDQYETMTDINKAFEAEMLNAGAADKNERKEMVEKAIKHNLGYMKHILNENQYHMYLRVLNVTLNNRGLK